LAPLLPKFAAADPTMVLEVPLADRPVDMVEGCCDIGIFIDLQKIDSSLIARKLAISSVVLTASPDYVVRKGAPQTPRELSRHDCLNHAWERLRHTWPCGGKPKVRAFTEFMLKSFPEPDSDSWLKSL